MVAVPVGAIAERRVIMRLMRAGAVSVETAHPLLTVRRQRAAILLVAILAMMGFFTFFLRSSIRP